MKNREGMNRWIREEVSDMAAADAEIEANFTLTSEEYRMSHAMDLEAAREGMDNARRLRNAKQRAYRKANRERINRQRRERYAENREHVLEQNRAWAKRNAEHISARRKVWYAENYDRIRQGQKEYRERNREKLAAKNRAWYQKNREKVSARKRKLCADLKVEKEGDLPDGWSVSGVPEMRRKVERLCGGPRRKGLHLPLV